MRGGSGNFSIIMQNLETDTASSPFLLTAFNNYSLLTSFCESKSLKNGPSGDHAAEGQLRGPYLYEKGALFLQG